MGGGIMMFAVFLLVVGALVYSIFSIQYQNERKWDEEKMIKYDDHDDDVDEDEDDE